MMDGFDTGGSSLYRAIWRWHFYAGLITLPFLVSMAITGGLYLFKDELNASVYRELMFVEPSRTQRLEPSMQIEYAARSFDGRVTGYIAPETPDRAARVLIDFENGGKQAVFVDPYSGKVSGHLAYGQFGNLPLMNLVRHLHSLESAGWIGNRLVEIVAGWVLILIISGVYLWWPRNQSGGVVTVRRNAGVRTFWRDLHAVTGIFAAISIFFLASTGLPWSGFWGERLKNVVNENGLGYPASFFFPLEESTIPLNEVIVPTPWTVANAPVPLSKSAGHPPIGIDKAILIFDQLGMHPGHTVSLPLGPTGVYSATVIPHRIAGARAIHLDQYSGDILFDVGYEDLGPAARAIEFGSSVHTGEEFGIANQVLMLLTCICIVLMATAAAVMWWKRRPRGTLGAPRYPDGFRIPRGILIVPLVFGIVFPLVGVSILVMLALDYLLPERLRERLG